MIESVIIRGRYSKLIELSLWRECNECHGDICNDCKHPEECLEDNMLICSCTKCNDKGRFPRYYTPLEFIRLTGIEVDDDFPVWYFFLKDWFQKSYGEIKYAYEFKNVPIVLNFNQIKPDINWKPE